MIIEFRSIQRKLNKHLDTYVRTKMREKGIMVNLIGTTIQHEGDRHTFQTVDGHIEEMQYKKAESFLNIPVIDMPTLKLRDILTKADGVAKDVTSQIEKTIFEKLNETTEKTGNIVDNRGRAFTFNTFLEGLEKVDWDFDETIDKPIMPTLVVHPDLEEKIKDKMPLWEKDEDNKKKIEELKKRKYDEWLSRENNRKLVD